MSWTPGEGIDTTIGLGVGCREPVDLLVNRTDRIAYLVLGRSVAEIRLEPVHLETIRDRLPVVLADLGVLDAAEQRAAEAGSRSIDLAACLIDEALAADLAGQHGRAGELRDTAGKLTAAAEALESALAAVADAGHVADRVAVDAERLIGEH